jgi:membrane-associated phospholipid phosphatase
LFLDALSEPMRLSAIVMIVAVLVGFAVAAALAITDHVYPLMETAAQQIATWARSRNNTIGRKLEALLEPHGPELPLFGLLAAALVGGLWAFFAILEDVATGEPLVAIDQLAYRFLSHLRTSEVDSLLVGATELGDAQVVVVVAATAIAVLALQEHLRAAKYVAVSIVGTSLWVWLIKTVLQRARPVDLYHGASEFSFPSGHAAVSLSLYGFLAVLLVHDASPKLRRAVLVVTATVLVLIGFSRIYLGAHWMSDVLAGVAFGIAWCAGLAVLYYRTRPVPLASGKLGALLLVAFLAAGAFHIVRSHASDIVRYGAVSPPGQ